LAFNYNHSLIPIGAEIQNITIWIENAFSVKHEIKEGMIISKRSDKTYYTLGMRPDDSKGNELNA